MIYILVKMNFVLVNTMLKENDDMKEKIRNLNDLNLNKMSQYSYKARLSYCLKCRMKKVSKNQRVDKTRKGKPMLLWKCAVSDNKKLRFIKEQEASGFLTGLLGVKSPFEGTPKLRNII